MNPTSFFPMTKAPFAKAPFKPKDPNEKKKLSFDKDIPQKKIYVPQDLQKWTKSIAYDKYWKFILKLNHTNKKIDCSYESKKSESKTIVGLRKIIYEMDSLVDASPCVEKTSLQRFGNPGYRIFFDKMSKKCPFLIQDFTKTVEMKDTPSYVIKELSVYLRESWGNRTRIDYGSGHEASFQFFLTCVNELGLVKSKEDCIFIVSRVFNEYIKLCRKIQIKYKLEPAGSHGCWGLDDFQFLPFLYGAAQLWDHDVIFPKDILEKSIHKDFEGKFLYFDAIAYINKVKRGPFYEHSSVLNSLKTVKTWRKINSGMIKMYDAEVLKKFVVVQHCLFGKLLPFEKLE